MPRISVIIPVHDRYERLRACLQSLAANDFGGTAEVIVINDGGPEHMRELEREWNGPWPLQWIDQPKSGPAVARNRAVRQSTGEILLFLNDDVVLEPAVLAGHDHAHQQQPGHAAMGNMRWHPEVITSEFMHWCAHHLHVHYLIDPAMNMTWEYFHTLNASIDRCWFEKGHWFDETFPDPAFEDTEFVYRLWKQGLKITFAPDATAYHHHHFNPGDYLRKSAMRGTSARKFLELYPELTDRILGEYHEAIKRTETRLFWHDLLRRTDGPAEWSARFALAFMAGYNNQPVPKSALQYR